MLRPMMSNRPKFGNYTPVAAPKNTRITSPKWAHISPKKGINNPKGFNQVRPKRGVTSPKKGLAMLSMHLITTRKGCILHTEAFFRQGLYNPRCFPQTGKIPRKIIMVEVKRENKTHINMLDLLHHITKK